MAFGEADMTSLYEKRWLKGNVIFSIIGIENQTMIDNDMVLRVLGYDGASYRSQLFDKNTSRRYPVITIVLYYGKDSWNAPRSLKERLDVPECLDKYVSDYHINVFDISHMSDEEVDTLFHSDFKILAKFMNGTTDACEIKGKIEYPDPLLKLLSILTGDNRFEALKGEFVEGGATMCDVLDRVENKGKHEANRETATNLIKKGISLDVIEACIPSLPKDEIQEIFNSITENS